MSVHFPSPFDADISFTAVDSRTTYKLKPQEQALLSARATRQRQEQFRLGRAAAACALEQAGLSPAPPVLRGTRGEPLWPKSLVGSISHSFDMAVCALARSSDYLGIGIDLQSLQENRNISPNILKRITTEQESKWAASAEQNWLERALLIFSAKEAIFKALYPLLLREIGFKQAQLTWSQDLQAFEAKMDLDLSNIDCSNKFIVRVCRTDNQILTGLAIQRHLS